MITKFTEYIVESRMYIDELETLTPDQLGELLLDEMTKYPPDFQHIQDIIAVGCPIDSKTDHGWTALHYAVMRDKLDIMKFLISKGADINARDKKGWTVLHLAARDEKLDVLRFLISKGADIQAKTDGGYRAWNLGWGIREECPELNPDK